MKPPRPRLLTSTKNLVVINWSLQPTFSSSGSSSSLLQRTRQSRSSLSSEDRKVSRTSLGSADTSAARKSLRTPIESMEENNLLESPVETFCQTKEWYTLQRKGYLLGWTTVYWGYKRQAEISPLAPGEVHQFRLKVTTEDEDSEWGDILTVATKDEIVSAASLHRALDQSQITNARKILALRNTALEIPDKHGRTPLAVASVRGDAAICNMLLTCGADIQAQECGSLRTPLMMAAFKGNPELIHVFTERDGTWLAKDRFGQTAAHYSVMNFQLSAVQLVVKNIPNINVKDNFGWTPLMLAVTLRAPKEIVEFLLENGADVNDTDKRHQTVLMQAVISGNSEVVELLLDKGADVELENCNGHTANELAAQSPAMMKFLPRLHCNKKVQTDHLPKKRKYSQQIPYLGI